MHGELPSFSSNKMDWRCYVFLFVTLSIVSPIIAWGQAKDLNLLMSFALKSCMCTCVECTLESTWHLSATLCGGVGILVCSERDHWIMRKLTLWFVVALPLSLSLLNHFLLIQLVLQIQCGISDAVHWILPFTLISGSSSSFMKHGNQQYLIFEPWTKMSRLLNKSPAWINLMKPWMYCIKPRLKALTLTSS